MDIQQVLSATPAQRFRLKEKRPGIFQLIAPLFYADGDMMSLYLQMTDDGRILIRDFGETLMRLSYTFDIDTDKKRRMLLDTASARNAECVDGDLQLVSTLDAVFESIMSFAQLITSVMDLGMLSHETVAQLFYDQLEETVARFGLQADVRQKYVPDNCADVCVDYAFLAPNVRRPIYLFGVKDTNKAQQATIHCMNLELHKVPHKSVVVFEDTQQLSSFARKSLINAAGKSFDGLAGFQEHGAQYIENELLAV